MTPNNMSKILGVFLTTLLATLGASAQEAEGAEEPTPAVDTATQDEPSDPPAETDAPVEATETDCTNGEDDDGDGLPDCGDADCFDNPRCEGGGSEERDDAACSDWVDNDGDGATDCDDEDCNTVSVS